MERRIVAQFLTCMDGVCYHSYHLSPNICSYISLDMSWDKTDNKPIIVIGATNRPDSLDAALRRAGRFDHEICMGVPDEEARAKWANIHFSSIIYSFLDNVDRILKVLCAKLRLEGDFDFTALAKATPGYVGADLAALTGAAGIIAVKRIFRQLSDGTLVLPGDVDSSLQDHQEQDQNSMAIDEPPNPPQLLPQTAPVPELHPSISHFLRTHPSPLTPLQLEPIFITSSDFTHALSTITPSSKREGFATIPDVSWSDVGALHDIREELSMSIVQPIKRPELFRRVGIEAACGVLMWGPPGCGKTLLAKAVAKESGASFISVKGPEVLNKVGGFFFFFHPARG